MYNAQVSLATLGAVYVQGVDLYYNDLNGNVVKLTTGGSVNATSSGISSGSATAAFAGGVLVVNAAVNTPANIQGGSILLGNNVALSNYLTLSPPNSMPASFTLTLPSIPVANSFMTITSAGVMAGGVSLTGGITGSMLAANSITGSNIQAAAITGSNIAAMTITAANIANNTITGTQINNNAGITYSQLSGILSATGTSSGSYSNSTNSFTVACSANLGGNMVTGRPVWISFNGATFNQNFLTVDAGGVANFEIRRFNGSTSQVVYFSSIQSTGNDQCFPTSVLNFVDPSPQAGFTTYQLLANVSASNTVGITSTIMSLVQA